MMHGSDLHGAWNVTVSILHVCCYSAGDDGTTLTLTIAIQASKQVRMVDIYGFEVIYGFQLEV